MRGRVVSPILVGLVAVLLVQFAAPASARLLGSPFEEQVLAAQSGDRPAWKARLDEILDGKPAGVAVRIGGRRAYAWAARARRVPASNQKLLLSMAVLDSLGPSPDLPTIVLAKAVVNGVVDGSLWVVGRGNPSIASNAAYDRTLPFDATRAGDIADAVVAAGVKRIEGRVKGGVSYFSHDWFASGWKSYFPDLYVALPSALTIDGNRLNGKHISDPERRVAKVLTEKLEDRGVRVEGRPSSGSVPSGLIQITRVGSPSFAAMLRYGNRWSSNFFAEMFGKRLAVASGRVPGTIDGGGDAIEAFTESRGVKVTAYDGSGLSYSNRVSPKGMARLLDVVEEESWGNLLRRSLPKGGQGTLKDRFHQVRVRAKTGTLTNISSLSGWVWLERRSEWAAFSILSAGMSKPAAVDMENAVVRTLANRAR